MVHFGEQPKPLIPEVIYANYFSDETFFPMDTTFNEVPKSGWENAIKYYHEENYELAAALLTICLPTLSLIMLQKPCYIMESAT